MTDNIYIKKSSKLGNSGILKMFSNKVRGSGIVMKVKGGRFFERQSSKFKTKKAAIRKIAMANLTKQLDKMGKKPTKKLLRNLRQSTI